MQTREQKLKLLNKTIETLWHGVEGTKTGDYPRIVINEITMSDELYENIKGKEI